jgi:hypothetical protein
VTLLGLLIVGSSLVERWRTNGSTSRHSQVHREFDIDFEQILNLEFAVEFDVVGIVWKVCPIWRMYSNLVNVLRSLWTMNSYSKIAPGRPEGGGGSTLRLVGWAR